MGPHGEVGGWLEMSLGVTGHIQQDVQRFSMDFAVGFINMGICRVGWAKREDFWKKRKKIRGMFGKEK